VASTTNLTTKLTTKFCGTPQKKSPNFTKKSKIDVVAVLLVVPMDSADFNVSKTLLFLI
jgi:hypothetical protein